MSLAHPVDGWDANARKLLLRRILEGSPDASVNYAPDLGGPLTIQISEILRNHAGLWAHDRREGARLEMAADGLNLWREHMREADEEIARFLKSHTLGRGAA